MPFSIFEKIDQCVICDKQPDKNNKASTQRALIKDPKNKDSKPQNQETKPITTQPLLAETSNMAYKEKKRITTIVDKSTAKNKRLRTLFQLPRSILSISLIVVKNIIGLIKT